MAGGGGWEGHVSAMQFISARIPKLVTPWLQGAAKGKLAR